MNLCSEFSFFLFISGYGRNTLWRQVRSHGFRKRACKGSAWDQFIGEVTRTETNSFLKDYWDTSYVYKCTLPSPKKKIGEGEERGRLYTGYEKLSLHYSLPLQYFPLYPFAHSHHHSFLSGSSVSSSRHVPPFKHGFGWQKGFSFKRKREKKKLLENGLLAFSYILKETFGHNHKFTG